MKYDGLSREELLRKVNEFELELKGYVDRVDQRYKVFFERNLAGLYRTKLSGEIIDCNDAMAVILGYKSREDLIGKNAKLLYWDVKEREKHIDLLKKNQFVRNKKLALKRKDGSLIWVAISTSEILNTEGNVEYLEGNIIDVTDLINTQEKLIKSEENYKKMLDESPYGILIHKDGKIRYCNKRASQILEEKIKPDADIRNFFPEEVFKKSNGNKSILHFDRVESNAGEKPVFLDLYVKEVDYENDKMSEMSFVDIQDRIELEEEKIKNYVFKNLNEKLKKEIENKEKAELELKDSLQMNVKQSAKLNAIFENSSHVIWTLDRDFRLTSFNKNFSDLFHRINGSRPKIDKNILNEFPTTNRVLSKQWKESHEKVFEGELINFISEVKDKKGRKTYINIFLNPIYDNKKGVLEASGIGHDITDKVIAEAKLTESLKEKEVLIKEIHHRVKNNLQVISSIFNLQSAFTTEEKIKEVLRESQNRIKSMAYIHESLYKSSQLGRIDFEQYVKELSKNLIHSYAYNSSQVSLLTETESVLLDLDLAIPCGLIVNEIVSNSLKHAFQGRPSGIIAVRLRNNNNSIKLRLTDDGIGIPENTFDKDTGSLGIQLIQTLTEQIRGELSVDGSNGTTIEIKFPLG